MRLLEKAPRHDFDTAHMIRAGYESDMTGICGIRVGIDPVADRYDLGNSVAAGVNNRDPAHVVFVLKKNPAIAVFIITQQPVGGRIDRHKFL